MMPNRVNFTLLLILLLALALRLISLDDHSLWYDEAFAVLFAEKGLDAMLYGTLTPVAGGASDIHPLLYYMTLNVWMGLFGQAAFTVRLWSVLLGLGNIGLIYLIGRDLFGQRTGYVAAFLTAIFPFHIHYSQETRMYTLLVLLLLLATYCYLLATKRHNAAAQRHRDTENQINNNSPEKPADGRRILRPYGSTPSAFWRGVWRVRWWVLFGICAGLAMYTQQLAAFYLMSIGVLPLFTRRRDHFIGMVIGVSVALLVYAPWLVNIPSQLQKVNSYYWVTQPGIDKPIVTLYLFLTTYAEIPAPWSPMALLGSIFLVTVALVQVVIYLTNPRFLRKSRRSDTGDKSPLLFVLWLAFAPMLLMWLVSQIQPVYLERSLMTPAVMLYLFLAWFFTRSGIPRAIGVLMAGIVVMQVSIGLGVQYTLATFPYSPVREMIACVRQNYQPGDVVIHNNKLSMLPGVFYGRDLPQRYIGDEPGSPEDTLAVPTQEALNLLADNDIVSAAAEAKRIWFVTYQRAEFQYEAGGRSELRDTFAWLEEHYPPGRKLTFNDLNMYLYGEGTLLVQCP